MNLQTSILVTGGLGYIGSHTCVELIKAGIKPVILDNLSNCESVDKVIDGIEAITSYRPPVYIGDVRNAPDISKVFDENEIRHVIHFAGVKVASESVTAPLKYYFNNVIGSLHLLNMMKAYNINKLIFSSTAAVYSSSATSPINEFAAVKPETPYGESKLMVETMIRDHALANPQFSAVNLRYFNPVGAHSSGKIGENPKNEPTNLAPVITRVMAGNGKKVKVFGNDYPTTDGTGVRDYIHVVDLALGHLAAIDWIDKERGVNTFNLGTGEGTSVAEMIQTFSNTAQMVIPYSMEDRRAGDLAEVYADPSKAWSVLGWKTEQNIEDMCIDAWNWEQFNQKLDY